MFSFRTRCASKRAAHFAPKLAELERVLVPNGRVWTRVRCTLEAFWTCFARNRACLRVFFAKNVGHMYPMHRKNTNDLGAGWFGFARVLHKTLHVFCNDYRGLDAHVVKLVEIYARAHLSADACAEPCERVSAIPVFAWLAPPPGLWHKRGPWASGVATGQFSRPNKHPPRMPGNTSPTKTSSSIIRCTARNSSTVFVA